MTVTESRVWLSGSRAFQASQTGCISSTPGTAAPVIAGLEEAGEELAPGAEVRGHLRDGPVVVVGLGGGLLLRQPVQGGGEPGLGGVEGGDELVG